MPYELKERSAHVLSRSEVGRTALVGTIASALLAVTLSACGSKPGNREEGQLVYSTSAAPCLRQDRGCEGHPAGTLGTSGVAGLVLVDDDGGHRRPIARRQRATEVAPEWSPDGSRIAFVRTDQAIEDVPEYNEHLPGQVLVIEIATEAERWVAAGGEPHWSPDGSALLVQAGTKLRGRALAVATFADSPARPLEGGRGDRGHIHVSASYGAWSPDGRTIAFVRTRWLDESDYSQSTLYTVRADGTGLRKVTTSQIGGGPGVIDAAAWSSDGKSILVEEHRSESSSDRVVRAIQTDVRKESVLAGPESFVSQDYEIHIEDIAVSPDGKQIAFSGISFSGKAFNSETYWIRTVDVPDGESEVIVEIPEPDTLLRISQLAWSPGGSELAYVLRRENRSELYVVNADGSKRRRLSKSFELVGGFDWRPQTEAR